ncbi:MAG: hypothetical protein A2Y17_11645 [Clostridiales bacterium GWF2_38_85]|nr:MAG: hypothetical protein A2Y17_11645 [Clostridiales bacterium GWF2_38_85]
MRISNILYFFKQGFHGIIRNAVMSTASILILMSSMLVLGSFWMIITNINNYMSTIDDLNMVVLYLAEDTDDARAATIGDEIKAMDNVASVTFISKEEALDKMLEKYDETQRELIKEYTKVNPLPDSYQIVFTDIEKSSSLLYQLSNIDGIDKSVKENPKSNIDLANKVDNFKNGITMICMWLLIILLVVSLFVIMNTIRLTVFARRHEIIIMRYVGATSRFIIAPFLVEGIIIGVVSAAIAFGFQYYLYNYIMLGMLGNIDLSGLIPFSQFRDITALAFLGVGLFAGIIGSSMSMRKFLKV